MIWKSGVRLCVALACAVVAQNAVTVRVAAAPPNQARAVRGPVKKKPPVSREFKVPAGTTLSVELTSELSSDANHENDQVMGRLREPVNAEGVELVPGGARLLGAVTLASAPDRETGPGQIQIRFSVLEHPQTGSRIGIKTRPLAFIGQALKTRSHGLPATRLTDAHVERGAVLSVVLLEPFVVRIPTSDPRNP